MTDERAIPAEAVAAAIKATEYKYFGDYEMSDGQREAVDVLVEVARRYYTPAASSDERDGAREGIRKEIRRAWFNGRETRGKPYDSEAVEAGWDRQVDAALAASRPTDAGAEEPLQARDFAAQFYDKRDPLDRSYGEIAHNIRRGRYDDQDSVELVRFTIAALATPKPPVDEMRERCAKVADDAAEGARVLHNAAAKDRDRDGTLVHGEAWRVAKQIAAAIRNLTGDGAGA